MTKNAMWISKVSSFGLKAVAANPYFNLVHSFGGGKSFVGDIQFLLKFSFIEIEFDITQSEEDNCKSNINVNVYL